MGTDFDAARFASLATGPRFGVSQPQTRHFQLQPSIKKAKAKRSSRPTLIVWQPDRSGVAWLNLWVAGTNAAWNARPVEGCPVVERVAENWGRPEMAASAMEKCRIQRSLALSWAPQRCPVWARWHPKAKAINREDPNPSISILRRISIQTSLHDCPFSLPSNPSLSLFHIGPLLARKKRFKYQNAWTLCDTTCNAHAPCTNKVVVNLPGLPAWCLPLPCYSVRHHR